MRTAIWVGLMANVIESVVARGGYFPPLVTFVFLVSIAFLVWDIGEIKT